MNRRGFLAALLAVPAAALAGLGLRRVVEVEPPITASEILRRRAERIDDFVRRDMEAKARAWLEEERLAMYRALRSAAP